jgi:hypothetical protein
VTGASCADGAYISSSLGKVFWVEGCGNMALKIANLDGTNVQILDTFNTAGRFISPRGVTYDDATGNIYVIGSGGYAKGNINSLPLIATQSTSILGRAIAINSGTGKLYYTSQTNKISICNTDGTGVDTIRTGLSNSWGVQVDAENSKVYFADNKAIYKTNLDGTNFQTVYTFPTQLQFVSIAIDPRNDRLFWASNGGVINKCSMSGANPTQIITGQSGIFAITVGASSSRQASNINFNTITSTGAKAVWTKGDGAGRVAFLKADTLSIPVPADGITYTGNATFGSGTQIGTSGWFCVYSGTDSIVTITGLANNTTYRMMVMEYSGTGINRDYNVTYATLNPNKFRTGGVNNTTPTVLTVGATLISSTSAVLRGNVTSSGGAGVTERGVVYSTSPNPTIATATKIYIGFNVGSYGSNAIGLTPSTLYYYRAYAINSVGTAYGNDTTFTTLAQATFAPSVVTSKATLIGSTNATLGGNVSDSGTATVTERGIVYATTINPTTANTKVQIGTGIGTFSQNITGLSAATLYHVRAYAINSVGTSYGADSTFTTNSLPTFSPTVSTAKATLIGSSNATLGGNVSDGGTAAVTDRGIVYSTSANPTTSNTKVQIGTGIGAFSQNITGLNSLTTYHVRAYAINSVGTSYGADSTFTTISDAIANNTIASAQNLCTGDVADTLKGSFPSGGIPPYQYVWLSSTTSATAGFGAASGTNNTQNYLAGALAQTTWFKRVAMDGTNSDTSNVVAITITATPAKPVISTKPLAPVCLGTNYLNFGANAAPASGVNYNWTTENALVYAQGNTRQFSLISFNAAGKAKVILTASANGCSSKDEVEYDITSDVSHLATVRYFNKNFVCEANMVNKYQWGYDMQPSLEGALVNGEINQNYFNATPDFTNRNYWAISATATCYQKTYYNKPTDVRENSMNENGLMVYPNPVNNQLNIKHNGAKGSMVVQVLDMHGKICQEVLSVQTETTINIEALAPGVYLVRCVLENDVVVNTKVVKN